MAALSEQLKRVPELFPELGSDGGMLGKMFTAVILPQMVVAAKKDEAGTRGKIVEIMRRMIALLEIAPEELRPSRDA